VVLGFLGFALLRVVAQQPIDAAAGKPKDELAVYAAVLDASEKLGPASRPLIADTTSTFACGTTICNGSSMGGCNGLRTANEAPSERLAIVKRDITDLEGDTVSNFDQQNQKCASVSHDIPTISDYHLFSDADIPTTWKYSFLVYFSRVGFNARHTQALVNVGLMSARSLGNPVGGATSPVTFRPAALPSPSRETAINCSRYSESVGRNREGRIDRSTGWHERSIRNKEIGDAMRPAVSIDYPDRRVIAHYTCAARMTEVELNILWEKHQTPFFQAIGQ